MKKKRYWKKWWIWLILFILLFLAIILIMKWGILQNTFNKPFETPYSPIGSGGIKHYVH